MAAKSYADVAKGVPVCRVCQNKRQPVWSNDRFSVYTAVKSAWPGHCFIIPKEHITPADFHRLPAMVEELYAKILPRLCDALGKILPATSFDHVQTGHASHMCLQILPRRSQGGSIYINQFRCEYQDPQPQQALDMSIQTPVHNIDITQELTSQLNPPMLVASEPTTTTTTTPATVPPPPPAPPSSSSSCCIM